MQWRDIPSLAALRAFETASRLRSFSAAARELNVTHAAIAQHVRGLERELGQSLMLRDGAGMALTETGTQLADALSEGFNTISKGVAETRTAGAQRPLNVTMTPNFAENWLMPRVGAFWAQYPDIQLALLPNTELVDLRRGGFDLAIRYGQGDWGGQDHELLVAAHYVVVGAYTLVKDLKSHDLDGLCCLPWLFATGRAEPRVWVEEHGIELENAKVVELATNSMVLAGVREGLGLSIQSRPLIAKDLEAGHLEIVYEAGPSPLGYYLVIPPGPHSASLQVFMKWLRESV